MQNNLPGNGLMLEPNSLMLGCLLLKCNKQPISLPRLPLSKFRSHIDGSPNGKVLIKSDHCREVFQPTRNRSYVLHSMVETSEPEATELMGKYLATDDSGTVLRARVARVDYAYPNVICIEQTQPFGLTAIVSRSVEITFFGVYSDNQDWLVWTNAPDYINEIQPVGSQIWAHRFAPKKDFGVVLPTRRVCNRWFRWSESLNLKDSAKRFQALEQSLFPL